MVIDFYSNNFSNFSIKHPVWLEHLVVLICIRKVLTIDIAWYSSLFPLLLTGTFKTHQPCYTPATADDLLHSRLPEERQRYSQIVKNSTNSGRYAKSGILEQIHESEALFYSLARSRVRPRVSKYVSFELYHYRSVWFGDCIFLIKVLCHF